MKEHTDSSTKRTALTTPIAVFFTSLIGPVIVLALPSTLGWPSDYLPSHLYLFGTLGQALMDLPAVVMLAPTAAAWMGDKHDRLISFGIGVIGSAVFAVAKFAISGTLIFMGGVPAFAQSLILAWPWNLIATILTVLAYGPAEALYIIYFVIAFDAALDSGPRAISPGTAISALLWGLPHIWNVLLFGWVALGNAFLMVGIGLVIGLFFRRSRSALGPVAFWSLINGTSV